MQKKRMIRGLTCVNETAIGGPESPSLGGGGYQAGSKENCTGQVAMRANRKRDIGDKMPMRRRLGRDTYQAVDSDDDAEMTREYDTETNFSLDDNHLSYSTSAASVAAASAIAASLEQFYDARQELGELDASRDSILLLPRSSSSRLASANVYPSRTQGLSNSPNYQSLTGLRQASGGPMGNPIGNQYYTVGSSQLSGLAGSSLSSLGPNSTIAGQGQLRQQMSAMNHPAGCLGNATSGCGRQLPTIPGGRTPTLPTQQFHAANQTPMYNLPLHQQQQLQHPASQQHVSLRRSASAALGSNQIQPPTHLEPSAPAQLSHLSLAPSTDVKLDLDPRERLIDAIESLRDSIQDNTSIQTRHTRPRQRRPGGGGGGGGGGQANFVGGSKASGGQQGKADDRLKVRREKVAVEVRVVFLKIGEIDTLKEFYHADVFIQAKWREPRLDGQTAEELLAVDLDKYWNPLLYIDNILTESKDAQWLMAQANEMGEVTIFERRRIKGVFLETLELNDFPLDVQDLTITLTTERPDTEVDLIPDQVEMSAINIQTFVDQQEWRLHEHVEITKRIMTQEYSSSMKSHPCLSVTCRAARRPGYFYWNVFLIMFMISGLSFATFAVTPDKAEYRLRLSFTLVLTSVTFKYVITQSLPKISYLTYMDKYVLMSLAILCVVSIWHAVVTLIPHTPLPSLNRTLSTTTASPRLLVPPGVDGDAYESSDASTTTFFYDDSVTSSAISSKVPQSSLTGFISSTETKRRKARLNFMKDLERDVFVSFCCLYILAHLIFIFWLYFDASKRRREMTQKDREYREFLKKNKNWQDTNKANAQRRKSSAHVGDVRV